ncbi:unnamed protein product, partial [Polarella glacialis]
EFRGTPFPEPQNGAVRVSFWQSAFAITPVWPAKGQKPSVKVTFALSRRPSSAAFIFSS